MEEDDYDKKIGDLYINDDVEDIYGCYKRPWSSNSYKSSKPNKNTEGSIVDNEKQKVAKDVKQVPNCFDINFYSECMKNSKTFEEKTFWGKVKAYATSVQDLYQFAGERFYSFIDNLEMPKSIDTSFDKSELTMPNCIKDLLRTEDVLFNSSGFSYVKKMFDGVKITKAKNNVLRQLAMYGAKAWTYANSGLEKYDPFGDFVVKEYSYLRRDIIKSVEYSNWEKEDRTEIEKKGMLEKMTLLMNNDVTSSSNKMRQWAVSVENLIQKHDTFENDKYHKFKQDHNERILLRDKGFFRESIYPFYSFDIYNDYLSYESVCESILVDDLKLHSVGYYSAELCKLDFDFKEHLEQKDDNEKVSFWFYGKYNTIYSIIAKIKKLISREKSRSCKDKKILKEIALLYEDLDTISRDFDKKSDNLSRLNDYDKTMKKIGSTMQTAKEFVDEVVNLLPAD